MATRDQIINELTPDSSIQKFEAASFLWRRKRFTNDRDFSIVQGCEGPGVRVHNELTTRGRGRVCGNNW